MARNQFPWGNSDFFGIDLVCGRYIIGELDNMIPCKFLIVGHLTPRPLWSPENLLTFVSALSAPNRSLGLEDHSFAIIMLFEHEEVFRLSRISRLGMLQCWPMGI